MADSIVILALGSNMGDRFMHLQNAIRSLDSFLDISDISSIYETPPYGMKANQDFLNLCLIGTSECGPFEILEKCQKIEVENGRHKDPEKSGFQSRPVDIDILFFGDEVIHTKDLVIPHPEMVKRNFVLTPLSEIAPNFIHPLLNKSISKLLTELADNSKIEQITQQIPRNK